MFSLTTCYSNKIIALSLCTIFESLSIMLCKIPTKYNSIEGTLIVVSILNCSKDEICFCSKFIDDKNEMVLKKAL